MDRVPYVSLVGSLIFAMVCTRPDIAYSVGVLSRFMANPGKAHWEAAKWVLRYLRGKSDYSIYSKSLELMHAFFNANFSGDLDKKRSTTGYVFRFGNGPISWMSKFQSPHECARGVVDYRGRVYGVDGSLQGSGVASKFNAWDRQISQHTTQRTHSKREPINWVATSLWSVFP